MKRGTLAPGYTVVEVLIFLAVSSALFLIAFSAFGGQHRRTEFATGMRDIELIMQDVINDVSTGYYSRVGTFSCSASSSGPVINLAGNTPQGTNAGCTYIGRAIQFAVNGNRYNYNVYDIVGLKREWGTTHDVANLTQALPVVLNGAPFTNSLPGSMEVTTMKSVDGVSTTDIGTVAFVSTLGSSGGGLTSQSGSQSVDLIPLSGSQLSPAQAPSDAAAQIRGLATVANANPTGGVVLCFTGVLNNLYGEVTIGADRGRITTKTEIKSGTCT